MKLSRTIVWVQNGLKELNMNKFEMIIPTVGRDSDTRVILAIATSYMRRRGISNEEQDALRNRVHASHSVNEACRIIKEWFPLKPDPTKVKPKFPKRGKSGRFIKYEEEDYT
jgi:hypothetical protein